ncbi:ArnT family glycosyltransferase [Mycobacteroides chelonae]|uniref:ArnT family glycosyltransferase n=1 Tax=Mycobacteroides chelonae TaxID=1774 RepID=UPI0006189FFA|nr:glycosyltransferase family 39 protein [Mycobacteroides chelonae]AKC41513.1 glycosyl transferase [Mycobacteroides chelonae]ANA99290.1 glycosyl transferase [Mycobacteroides chelonae CCUG 47445]OLT72974.1 glycosyl transferase [Mycobacteroides chelonae]ORV12511.1 glycosyl transferase [Mycobacteroides chelonae]
MSQTRERLIFAAILLTITVVYLWDISHNGWSNTFYAAAVQSGSESWKAWFFGSFDPQNYVTVDKPAGGLWLMGLSARIFGFSSASMLIPQAILAIVSAALIRATVRRQAGPSAGLLAAALFALIPVVSVMFRHSNPDAPMVFGMVVAAYFTTRAIDSERSRSAAGWLALAGVGIGFAFLCKTLEGLLVAPALLLAYLVSTKWPWKTTLMHLLGAAGALLAASGWWMAAVALTPAASRPYVDNSTDNSEWTLAVGYNGLDRLLGDNSNGMGGGRGSGPSFSGTPGIFRLFQDTQADHIAWLLPTAFIALILGLVIVSRTPQTAGWLGRLRTITTHPAGAGLVLWGTWMVSNYVVLSYMAKQFHPYYTSAMAPAIAGSLAIGTVLLWRHRSEPIGKFGLSALTLSATVMAFVLLRRIPTWLPWLRWLLLIGGILAAVALALSALERNVRLRYAIAGLALAVSLGGSLAFTIANVTTPKVGGLSTSGPAIANEEKFGGQAPTPLDPALAALIKDSGARWPVATTNTRTAAPIQLETNAPVMAIGGFSGRDNPITLQQFIDYTQDGTVQFYAESVKDKDKDKEQDKPQPQKDGDTKRVADDVQKWVETHFSSKDYGDLRVFDLSVPPKP